MRQYIYRRVPYLDLGDHYECFEVDVTTLQRISKSRLSAVVARSGSEPKWFQYEPEPLATLVTRWKRKASPLDRISVYRLNGNHVLYYRLTEVHER